MCGEVRGSFAPADATGAVAVAPTSNFYVQDLQLGHVLAEQWRQCLQLITAQKPARAAHKLRTALLKCVYGGGSSWFCARPHSF